MAFLAFLFHLMLTSLFAAVILLVFSLLIRINTKMSVLSDAVDALVAAVADETVVIQEAIAELSASGADSEQVARIQSATASLKAAHDALAAVEHPASE